ncbi:MAG TPA: glycosyltransferase [Chthoniobacterales bacterium]|nr:glycosyltransferase [Chthoniobacterales bacterium]
MFEKLPSLLGFKPKFYTAGPARFHLPLLYDLVASRSPRSIVALGFGDGQAFFTFCQAARERNIDCQCLALRREHAGEREVDDLAWLQGKDYGDEFYGDLARFQSGARVVEEVADRSVDLLLLDDCDSGAALRADLSVWESKLAPNGLVLVHGIALERGDDPKAAWVDWTKSRPAAEFPDGIGLGITLQSEARGSQEPLLEQLFAGNRSLSDLAELYRLAAARMEAQVRTEKAERAQTALEARQVWVDSLLADRWKVQEIMDHQTRTIDAQTERLKQFDILRRDRARAQLVMDEQAEQLKHWAAKAQRFEAERATLKAEVKEQKQVLNAAKKACRKKGRCFQGSDPAGENKRRSISERILREIKRAPRNLLGRREPAESRSTPKGRELKAEEKPADRYAAWIEEHEPDTAELERQSAASQGWVTQPKISLLVPVLDPQANFLEEMFSSVAKQTYQNWELCVVDAGSTDATTLQVLDSWVGRDARIRFERLEANLGIAANTNRALTLATGDFIACLDHDDLLAPFALYEIARAISRSPAAEIFYSDEDRWSEKGGRHAPFFKPEWSPELLYSSMYLGHLTAYRRDLVDLLGGFRTAFDLSQDYDFALRATERAQAVCHVPGVLYHWREHPGSGSAGGKPEARKTNLAALADAMERRGLAAEIVEYPTANRVRLKILEWPKVSIVIPTDSAERARLAVEQLPRMTSYSNYEIVIVTNSGLADVLELAAPKEPGFRFVRYDKPFNFSDKCNLGAQAATGTRLIFFNDDVESGQRDWIQNLIEPLENPEVGAVAPKLLYATGKIQHAGLVTGVRGLVGTACHEWPGDSVDYTNFAQSMRDVSALSAACLAMRRDDFFRVGEFDAVNTPIAHSDLDLCFKVREAGLRCVYTPFATMTHRGHVSLGAAQQEEEVPPREKASVYLLKRWAGYTCNDPYFPDDMRDWLYADSPTPIRMWGRNQSEASPDKLDLLFVSHDLSWSGAPLILLHMAKWCKAQGLFVAVMSPKDGPLREEFFKAGIPLLVDPLITTGHPSFTAFAREFDCVVASTIFGAPIVRAVKSAGIPHLWWIHEGRVAQHYLDTDPVLRGTLGMADLIVTPDTRSSLVYQPYADRPVRVMSYGIPDPLPKLESAVPRKTGPLKFLLLGTIEQRKGQQVFLEALKNLPEDVLKDAHFQIIGRPHDPAITSEVMAAARDSSYLTYGEGVSPAEALALIWDTDVMVCSSWDETGPLILMEALALEKVILSTSVGAVAEILSAEEDGLFFTPGDSAALAAAIQRLVREPDLVKRLRGNSRKGFEKYFTFDRFGESFVEAMREVISSRKIEPGASHESAT